MRTLILWRRRVYRQTQIRSGYTKDHCGDAELREFRAEFFCRLRAKAPQRLNRFIDGWETVYLWSDRIPLEGRYRRYRTELRKLAKEVLREMKEKLTG